MRYRDAPYTIPLILSTERIPQSDNAGNWFILFSTAFCATEDIKRLFTGSIHQNTTYHQMKTSEISRNKTILLAIIACIIWSTAFVTVKIGLTHMKPFSFAGIRFMLSGCILLPFWIRSTGLRGITTRSLLVIGKVALLQTFMLYGLFYYALTLVSGAVASIIIGASPIISAIVAHLVCRDDKLNRTKILCMLIAATGIVLVVLGMKPWEIGGRKEVFGLLLLMTGSIVSSLGNIIVSGDRKSINPLLLNSVQIFLGGFLLLVLSFFLEGTPDLSGHPISFYSVLGWLALVSAASFSIWFYLLQHDNVKVSELNFWKFLIPVFGATLSWVFLPDETPNILTVSGMVLVAYAVLIFNR